MAAPLDARTEQVSAAALVWAAAASLLVLLPNFSASPFADDYDSQRLLELAAATLAVVVLAAVPVARAAWLGVWARVPAWTVVLVAGIGALGVASASLAPRPVYAFAEVASYALMCVGTVGVASLGRIAARSGLALVAVLALGGYAVSVLPFHLIDLAMGAEDVWPARHLGFGNMRQVNHLQVWLLPLVWALAAAAAPGWKQAGLRSVASVTVALMIATNGRGILVALVVGLVVAVLAVRTSRRALLSEVAMSAVFGIGLWAVLFMGGVTALDKSEAGLSGRGELWVVALRMAAEHPWLGVGPMHFVYTPSPNGAHPHDLVLQIASEWGIPAALFAVALVLGVSAGWLRHARLASAGDAAWIAGLTVAFAAALAYSFFDGFLIAPVSQILAVLVLGALLAEALPESRVAPVSRASWRDLALAGVALPALAVLVAVAASDGPTLGRRDYDYRSAQVAKYSLPRFWSTGQIAGVLPPEQAQRWPDTVADVADR